MPTFNKLSLLSKYTNIPIMQKVQCYLFKVLFTLYIIYEVTINKQTNTYLYTILKFYFILTYMEIFSSFTHDTCTLSVIKKYLGLISGLIFYSYYLFLYLNKKISNVLMFLYIKLFYKMI